MSLLAHCGSKRRCPYGDDGDQGAPAGRRVFPRHFHDGPNPIAEPDAVVAADNASSADKSKGGAAAAQAKAPSAAQLYRHALESIFAFLDLREAAAALRVSKDWMAAVKAMAGLQQSVDPRGRLPLVAMAASPMGRHVSVIGGECERVKLSQEALFIMARHMAHLRALHCRSRVLGASGTVFFPAALRVLHFDLRDADTERVNAAVSAIGRLAHLETLEIEMHKIRRQVSFGPLAALPLLRSLAITEGRHETTLTDAQVDQLRALSWLQEFHFDSISTELLQRLLAQPHDLQWQQISLPHRPTDDFTALLPQLPSLTALDLNGAAVSHFDFLRRLPNLESLHCSFSSATATPKLVARLVDGLSHCNVARLSLRRYHGLTSVHLAELLPRLPRLQSLSLSELRIDSLSFLSQAPLTSQLSSLTLSECPRLPLGELRHVHSLRSLGRLDLDASFGERMDSYSRSLLEPPSLLLPQLQRFCYAPPSLVDLEQDALDFDVPDPMADDEPPHHLEDPEEEEEAEEAATDPESDADSDHDVDEY